MQRTSHMQHCCDFIVCVLHEAKIALSISWPCYDWLCRTLIVSLFNIYIFFFFQKNWKVMTFYLNNFGTFFLVCGVTLLALITDNLYIVACYLACNFFGMHQKHCHLHGEKDHFGLTLMPLVFILLFFVKLLRCIHEIN